VREVFAGLETVPWALAPWQTSKRMRTVTMQEKKRWSDVSSSMAAVFCLVQIMHNINDGSYGRLTHWVFFLRYVSVVISELGRVQVRGKADI